MLDRSSYGSEGVLLEAVLDKIIKIGSKRRHLHTIIFVPTLPFSTTNSDQNTASHPKTLRGCLGDFRNSHCSTLASDLLSVAGSSMRLLVGGVEHAAAASHQESASYTLISE